MLRGSVLFLATALLFGFPAASELHAQNVSTSVVTTPSVAAITQRDYRWYANEDALTPTGALAAENVTTSVPVSGTALRLRMNIGAETFSLTAGTTFLLQYATNTSGPWVSLSTSTNWIFADNLGVADGQIIVTTVLSSSDIGESYGESNPSASSPNTVSAGQEGEWDWVIQSNAATTTASWFFRMIYSSGTTLSAYTRYPTLAATTTITTTSTATTTTGGSVSTYGGGGGFPLPPFRIETEIPPPSPCDSPIVERVDLSGDCRVDMVDLSILMYYYGRAESVIAEYDFNENGRVDLFDVSVMMYYWTG